MKILFMGDVMGEPGLRAVRNFLPPLRQRVRPDLVIANGENIAEGAGIGSTQVDILFSAGIDVVTNGNHVWDKPQAWSLVEQDRRLLRPHNLPADSPGSGWWISESVNGVRVGVLNLLGTAFMQPLAACPFRQADATLAARPKDVSVVIVDFHAETTLEKAAMGWHLDGRVSAVLGTHTHIPTADERILSRGTAFISDVGMCGCYDSVIGLGIDNTLQRILNKRPAPYDVAQGRASLCSVLLDIDEATGQARSITRIREDEAAF